MKPSNDDRDRNKGSHAHRQKPGTGFAVGLAEQNNGTDLEDRQHRSSRLALGLHFFSDVLGRIVLGAAWLIASTAAFEICRAERGRRPVQLLTKGVEPEAAKDLKP